MEKQPSLFSEPDTQSAAIDSPNTLEVSEKIAANATPFDYPDRTSEAARDQGWGPVTATTSTEESTDHSQARLFELSGKDGRNNWYNQPLPSPNEVQQGMTDEAVERQREINRIGAAAAKAALSPDQIKN